MPGSAVGIELNYGYPGSFTRSIDTIVTPRTLKSTITNGAETLAAVQFGEPVILNAADNTYSRFGATGTAATFAGVAVREVKQAVDYYNGAGSYVPGEVMDVMQRGSIAVKCNVGTPTAGGKVYVRIAENASIPAGVVGQFEAAADSTNTVEITNARWKTGKKDSNNVAELTMLTRVNP